MKLHIKHDMYIIVSTGPIFDLCVVLSGLGFIRLTINYRLTSLTMLLIVTDSRSWLFRYRPFRTWLCFRKTL